MLPPWWKGGFPDSEELLKSVFEPHLSDVEFVPSLPAPGTYEDTLNSGGAFMRFARTGGRINFDQNRDEPRIQIAVICRSRGTSWDLIEFARQTLWQGYNKGAIVPGTTHQLQVSEELLGPQPIPENLAEPRLVPITFGLATWKPGGTDYRPHLST